MAASTCSGDTAKWVGRWEGDLQRADPSAPDDPTKRTINLLRVDIKPDGTFEMLESGIGKSGTHKLGSERAVLRVTKIMGQPVAEIGGGTERENRQITLTWRDDGTAVYSDPAGFDGDVLLKKTTGE